MNASPAPRYTAGQVMLEPPTVLSCRRTILRSSGTCGWSGRFECRPDASARLAYVER